MRHRWPRRSEDLMPEARFELARGCPRWILSPLRLPFRHSGHCLTYTSTRFEGIRVTFALSPRSALLARSSSLARHPDRPTPPAELTAVIEIPTNERNKYELDKTLGIYRLDRVLHSAVHYPGNYGFLPRTLGEDGDPLDVLVLMTIPVFTGRLVDVRPVGLFHLANREAADEKVVAVPVGDPYSEAPSDPEVLSGLQGPGRDPDRRQGGSRGPERERSGSPGDRAVRRQVRGHRYHTLSP